MTVAESRQAARHLTAWDADAGARSARHDAGLSTEETAERATRAAVTASYALLAGEQSLPTERLQPAPADLLEAPVEDRHGRLSARDAERALDDLRELGF